MLFSLLYCLVRRLLGTGAPRPDERDIELLVLRHQVKVLQRQVKRPRLNRFDRLLLAAASARLPRRSWSSFIVRPETLRRWHRELVRKKWTFRKTGQPGRPLGRPQPSSRGGTVHHHRLPESPSVEVSTKAGQLHINGPGTTDAWDRTSAGWSRSPSSSAVVMPPATTNRPTIPYRCGGSWATVKPIQGHDFRHLLVRAGRFRM